MMFHEDDRAQRILDLFPLEKGQINISYVNSTEHVVAWHYHKIQTDYLYCIKGSFKVGLIDDATKEHKWVYISDKNPNKLVRILPYTWHGYKALEPNSIMIYYLTEQYNPEDEYKVPANHFPINWTTENK